MVDLPESNRRNMSHNHTAFPITHKANIFVEPAAGSLQHAVIASANFNREAYGVGTRDDHIESVVA